MQHNINQVRQTIVVYDRFMVVEQLGARRPFKVIDRTGRIGTVGFSSRLVASAQARYLEEVMP